MSNWSTDQEKDDFRADTTHVASMKTRASAPEGAGLTNKNRPLWWLGWPLSWTYVVVPAVLIVLANITLTASAFNWRYGLWWYASTAWHDNLIVVGAIGAGAATAFVTTLYRGRSNLFVRGHVVRTPWTRLMRHLGVLLVWCSAAHVAGLIPLMVRTATTASGGHLLPCSVFRGIVGLWVCTIFGYVLGMFTRSPAWAPVAALAMFVWGALPTFIGYQFSTVSPVLAWPVGNWAKLAPWPLLFTMVFFFAIILSSVYAALMLLSKERTRALPFAAAAATVALGTAALLWRPMTVVRAQPLMECTQVLADGRAIPTCLAEADKVLLPDLSRAVEFVVAAGAGPFFDRVGDANSMNAGDKVAAVAASPMATIPDMVDSLIATAATGPACFSGSTSSVGQRSAIIHEAIVARLMAQAKRPNEPIVVPSSIKPNHYSYSVWRLDRGRFEAIVRANLLKIRSCSLTSMI